MGIIVMDYCFYSKQAYQDSTKEKRRAQIAQGFVQIFLLSHVLIVIMAK